MTARADCRSTPRATTCRARASRSRPPRSSFLARAGDGQRPAPRQVVAALVHRAIAVVRLRDVHAVDVRLVRAPARHGGADRDTQRLPTLERLEGDDDA